MIKLRVSFEITDTWNRQDFRDLIKLLLYQPESICGDSETQVEVFIISNDDSSATIYKVANVLGLDANHTIVCNFTIDKVNAISNNNIDIHFDNLQYVVNEIDTATDAEAILVTSLPDRYNVKMAYVTEFENDLRVIINEKKAKAC